MIDLAKVVIWAEDKTKEGLQSAQRNLQGVHNEVDTLKGKLVALGGLLGITAFANMVKGAIDAQAKIKDLAIEAGMTAEQLSRFEEVGRMSGDGLEGIASAVGKMSRALVQAKDPTSAAAQALKAINLTWKDLQGLSPDEQLIKIAKAQAQFAGGTEKNAAMMEIFGKSGNKFQVTLAEIAEAQKLAASTSNGQADAADAFNDSLAQLGLRFAKFGRQIADEVLAYLNPLVKAMTELPEKSFSTIGVIDILAGTLKYVGGIILSVWLALQDMGDALGATAAKAVAFFSGDWNGIAAINKAREEQARKNEEAYNRMWDRLKGNLKEEIVLTKQRDELKYRPNAGKEAADELKAYETANQKLDEQIALWRERERLGRQLTESEKELAEIEAGKYAKLTPLHQAELKAKAELWAIEQRLALSAKADLDARLAEAAALGKVIESLNEKVAAAKLENDTYGKTKVQVEQLTIARLEERRAQLLGVEGSDLHVKMLDLEIAKRRELLGEYQRGEKLDMLRREMELEAQVWDEGASRGANFFVDLATNGRKAFTNLRDEAKRFGQEMLAIFAKKLILNLGFNMTGNAALGTMAGEAGRGTLAGSALSAGLNWAGSSIPGVAAAGEFGSAALGTFVGPAAPGSAAAMGQGVYAALSSIPVWGWAILAAAAIAAVVSASRSGGPKEGGSFFGAYDSAGNPLGSQAVPGTDNGRFFTPSGGDAAAQAATDALAQAFYQSLRRLGGTSGGLNFGFGFDKDPRGSADNRVSSLVTDASGAVLYRNTQTAGRDDADFERALGLEAKRALLAALQASDLPEAVAAILAPLDVLGASAEQIDAALAAADAMAQIIGALAGLKIPGLDIDALKAFQRDGEALEATLSRVAGLWSQYQQTFLSDVEKIAIAQGTVTQVFSELGIAVPESMDAFKDLVAGLDLTTEAGRTMWESLMEVAPAFASVATAATQAAADAAAAAATMLASFDSVMAQLRGSPYTRAVTQMSLDSALQQFQGANAWSSGMSLDALLGQILTITREDFQNYGADMQDLILKILSTYQALTGLDTPITTFTTGVTDVGTAISGAIDPLKNFADTVNGIVTDWTNARSGLGGGGGSMAQQLQLRVGTMLGQTNQLGQTYLEQLALGNPDAPAILEALTKMSGEYWRQKGVLDVLTETSALYGTAVGEQIASLEDWYTTQKKIFEGNAEIMAAIDKFYNERRTQIIDTAKADKAVKAMQDILAAIDAIAAASADLRRTIQGLRETMPGYDIRGARQASVRDAYSAFAAITSGTAIDERLRRATTYRDAVLANHDYEMGLLQAKADAERAAYQAGIEAQRQAADAQNALTQAFQSLGDYARELLIDADSPLTGKQRLEEINRRYMEALAGARANDLDSIGSLQGLAGARLDAARGQATTLIDYQREAFRVQKDLADLGVRGDRAMVEVIDAGFQISADLQREMNTLTQDTIDTLEGIDEAMQAWITQQEVLLGAQAEIFRSIDSGVAALVLNTAGLDTRIAAAIAASVLPPVFVSSAGPVSSGAGTTAMAGPRGGIPSYDVGTPFVPFDQLAMVHRGERIVPAAQNRPDATNAKLVAEMADMKVQLQAALVAIAQNTSKTARILQKFDGDGMPETRVLS